MIDFELLAKEIRELGDGTVFSIADNGDVQARPDEETPVVHGDRIGDVTIVGDGLWQAVLIERVFIQHIAEGVGSDRAKRLYDLTGPDVMFVVALVIDPHERDDDLLGWVVLRKDLDAPPRDEELSPMLARLLAESQQRNAAVQGLRTCVTAARQAAARDDVTLEQEVFVLRNALGSALSLLSNFGVTIEETP